MATLTTSKSTLPHKSRKEQVLERLRDLTNEWVDGSTLSTEQVGGTEGLRRVRELIEDGWPIEKRRHPSRVRGIWQYRLTSDERPENKEPKLPLDVPSEYDWKRVWKCETCGGPPRERPQHLMGDFGSAKCATCGIRRIFKKAV